jgi:hypothetical protein
MRHLGLGLFILVIGLACPADSTNASLLSQGASRNPLCRSCQALTNLKKRRRLRRRSCWKMALRFD